MTSTHFFALPNPRFHIDLELGASGGKGSLPRLGRLVGATHSHLHSGTTVYRAMDVLPLRKLS